MYIYQHDKGMAINYNSLYFIWLLLNVVFYDLPAPGQVGNVNVTNRKEGVIIIHWSEPVSQDGKADHYRIEISLPQKKNDTCNCTTNETCIIFPQNGEDKYLHSSRG